MDLDLVFLGTAGSVPTSRRSPASTLVRRGGARLLVDCGEGTQRQFLRSSVGLIDVPEVLLTHYHADHYLGLPGMLKTFALRGRELPMTVYGPPGLRELFRTLGRIFGKLSYAVDLVEVEPGDVLERDGYHLAAFTTQHGVRSQGYALVERPRPGRFDVKDALELGVPEGPLFGKLQRGERVQLETGQTVEPSQVIGPPRPGRKIVLTGDTKPTHAVLEVANEADLLVHDATFSAEERDRAEETGHSTASEAAEIGRLCAVRMLALTHVSTRYLGSEIAREAREIFPEAVVPRDFDIIDVPFQERGVPRLIKGGAMARRGATGPEGRDGAGGGGESSRGSGGDPNDPQPGGHQSSAGTKD